MQENIKKKLVTILKIYCFYIVVYFLLVNEYACIYVYNVYSYICIYFSLYFNLYL